MPDVFAHEPVIVSFTCPSAGPPGKYYVPRYKGPDYNQWATFTVDSGDHQNQGTYEWTGTGEYRSSTSEPATASTASEAHFRSTASETFTATCTQSAPLHQQSAPGTSGPICVFDAELTSSEAPTDATEETEPTFVGQDCRKTITILVLPGVGSLPTPPEPGYTLDDPAWSMFLAVENGAPGIAFYDATTGQQIMWPYWGWYLEEGYFDDQTFQWVDGHWYPLPGGLTPPSSVLVGLSPDGGSSFGAPLMVKLTLSVKDQGPPATAVDKVLVVPVRIDQSVLHDPDGAGPRNLWWFDMPVLHDVAETYSTAYSEDMTLTVSEVQNPQVTLTYAWSATGGHLALQDPLDQDHVVGWATSPSTQEYDNEVTVKIRGHDAARTKLTVYCPDQIQMKGSPPPNPSDSYWESGFNTTYTFMLCDQFGHKLPSGPHLAHRESFSGWLAPQGFNWGPHQPQGMSFTDGDYFSDTYGAAAGVPTPVHPDDPSAGNNVGIEAQQYWEGTSDDGFKAGLGAGVCSHSQNLDWHLGNARWSSELPPVYHP